MNFSWIAMISALCFGLGTTEEPTFLDLLQQRFKSSWATRYQPPDQELLDSCSLLFTRTLRDQIDDQLIADWGQQGFELEVQADVLVLADMQRRGLGFYLFRKKARPICLQAPHSSFDRNTGTLGLQLFSEHQVKALALNSCHRYKAATEQVPADMGHLSSSLFQVFTKAWAEVFPDSKVVQLHGFARENRTTDRSSSLDLILSSGYKEQRPSAIQAVSGLKDLPMEAGLYGRDVFELGGTTNSQFQLLKSLGFGGFLHVEMSSEARARLVTDKDLRARFFKAICGSD